MDYVVLDTDVASLSFRGRLHHRGADLGRLAAAAQRRGRVSPINDTWIAASCIAEGLPLATLNVKDYEGFAEHHGPIGVAKTDA